MHFSVHKVVFNPQNYIRNVHFLTAAFSDRL